MSTRSVKNDDRPHNHTAGSGQLFMQVASTLVRENEERHHPHISLWDTEDTFPVGWGLITRTDVLSNANTAEDFHRNRVLCINSKESKHLVSTAQGHVHNSHQRQHCAMDMSILVLLLYQKQLPMGYLTWLPRHVLQLPMNFSLNNFISYCTCGFKLGSATLTLCRSHC